MKTLHTQRMLAAVLCLAVVFALAVPAAYAQERILTTAEQGYANKVRNGSFESWSQGAQEAPNGWLAVSSPTIGQDEDKEIGTYAVKVTGNGTAAGLRQSSISVEPNTVYSLSFWFKSSLSGHTAQVRVVGNASGQLNLKAGLQSLSWNRYVATFSTGATDSAVSIELFAAEGSTVSFDGVMMNKGAEAVAFRPKSINETDNHIQFGDLTVQSKTSTDNIVLTADTASLAVDGDTVIGDTSADTLTVNATSTFNTDIVVNGSVTADSLVGPSVTSGTQSDSFEIDTDDSSATPILTFGANASAAPRIQTQVGDLTIAPAGGTTNITGALDISGTVTASNFSGTFDGTINASQVEAGTFDSGNFTFPDSVTVTDDLTVDTSTLFVDSTGDKVGIGTSEPGYALDVNGQVYANNTGTAFSTPGWFAATSSGKGLYSAVAGPLTVRNENAGGSVDIRTGGDNVRMTITPSGDVGIGTTEPEARLYVDSGSTADIAHFNNDNGQINLVGATGVVSVIGRNAANDGYLPIHLRAGANGLYVATDGNVGIGTTGPSQKLHISGGNIQLDNDYGIKIYDGGGTSRTVFKLTSDDLTDEVQVGGGGINHVSLMTAGTQRMTVDVDGNVGIGTTGPGADTPNGWNGGTLTEIRDTSNDVALLLRESDTAGLNLWYDASANDVYFDNAGNVDTADIYFRTKTKGAPVNALSILGSGKVGIGTTNPDEKLSIAGGNMSLWADNSKVYTNSDNLIIGADDNGSAGILHFQTGGSDKMVINNGSVGIGTTSPTGKLSVDGNLNFEAYQHNVGDKGIYWYADGDSAWGSLYREQTTGILKLTSQNSGLYVNSSGYQTWFGGNVGIGLTNPSVPLHVAGAAKITGALDMTSQQINNLAAPALDTDAATKAYVDSAVGSGHSGTGSQNYIAKWTGETVLANSQIFDNGTKVGIGTTNPVQNLHIHQADSGVNYIALTNSTTGATSSDGVIMGLQSDENFYLWHRENNSMLFGTNGTERMRITNGGKVGIGTTTPDSKLHIAYYGDSATTNSDAYALKLGETGQSIENGYTGIKFEVPAKGTGGGELSNAYIRAESASPVSPGYGYRSNLRFLVGGDSSAHGAFSFERFDVGGSGDATLAYIDAYTGNLGIGTTSPSVPLQVAGAAKIEGALDMSSQRITSLAAPSASTDAATKAYVDSATGSGLGGSGTASYMTKWSDSDTLTDSIAFDTGTNIGIGKTNPSSTLDVSGTAAISGNTVISGDTAFGGASIRSGYHTFQGGLQMDTGHAGGLITYEPQEGGEYSQRWMLRADYTDDASYPYLTNRTPSGKVVIKTGTAAGGGENAHFTIEGGDGTVDTYFENTNIGIGTTSPATRLEVVGESDLTSYTTSKEPFGSLISSPAAKTYPSTSSFDVVLGQKQELSANTTQTINDTTPGGYNFVYGDYMELTFDEETTPDLERLYITGHTDSINWTSPATAKQLVSDQASLTYNGSDQNGRTTSYITSSGAVRLRAPANSTQTVANIASSGLMIVNNSNTGVTNNITNWKGEQPRLVFLNTADNNTVNITDARFFTTICNLNSTGSGSTVNIENLYGLYLSEPVAFTGTTVTNNFGIYQEWDSAKNYFAGSVGIGTTNPSYSLDVAGAVNATTYYGDGSNLSNLPAGGQWSDAGAYIYANNSTNVVVTDTGYMGIGTTAPDGKLHIGDPGSLILDRNASGYGPSIEFREEGSRTWDIKQDTGGGNVEALQIRDASDIRMTMLQGGNVGIGTTSPGAKLDVVGVTYTDGLVSNGDTRPESNLGANLGTGSYYWNSGYINSFYTYGIRDYGSAIIDGNVGIGTTSPNEKLSIIASDGGSNLVQISNTDMGTGNDHGLYLGVTTADEGTIGTRSAHNFAIETNNVERIYVESDGNVGIGTTGPGYTLDVNGGIGASYLTDGSTRSTGYFASSADIAVNSVIYAAGLLHQGETGTGPAAIMFGHGATEGNDQISFVTGGGTRMYIASDGSVGIGTTAPGEKLDVAGNAEINGYIAVSTVGYLTWDGGVANTLNLRSNSGKGLSFGTNGVHDRMFINTSGNVGIGTTNPYTAGSSGSDPALSNSKLSILGALTFGETVAASETNLPAITQGSSDGTAQDLLIGARSGTGKLRFFTGNASTPNGEFGASSNAERMTILGSGNVGIGLTNPSYPLDVAGAVNATEFRLNGTAFNPGGQWTDAGAYIYANNASNVVVTDSGNVGIGTTAPSGKLGILAGSNDGVKVLSFQESTETFYLEANYAGTGETGNYLTMKDWSGHDVMTWRGDGNVGIGTTGPTQKLEVLGTGRFTNGGASTLIDVYADGTSARVGQNANSSLPVSLYGAGDVQVHIDSNNNSTGNVFSVRKDALHNGTELFRIQENGNVGIGTTSPGAKLEVYGSRPIKINPSGGNLEIKGDSGGWSTGLYFIGSSDTNRGGFGALGGDDNLAYYWIGDNYNDVTMVVKPNAGNVGIGTTNPGYKLDVSGTGNITSNLTVGGNVTVDNTSDDYFGSDNGSNFWKPIDTYGNSYLRIGTGWNYQDAGAHLFRELSNTSHLVTIDDGSISASGYGSFNGEGLSNSLRVGGIYSDLGLYAADYNMQFDIGNSAKDFEFTVGNVTKMLIDGSTGNVGIGTTNPGYKLDVNGTMQVTGDIDFAPASGPHLTSYFSGGQKVHHVKIINDSQGTGDSNAWQKIASWSHVAGGYRRKNLEITARNQVDDNFMGYAKVFLYTYNSPSAGNIFLSQEEYYETGSYSPEFKLMRTSGNPGTEATNYELWVHWNGHWQDGFILEAVETQGGTGDITWYNQDTYTMTEPTGLEEAEGVKYSMTTDDRVGIGTASPSYNLDVNGTLNATTIYQNGSLVDGTNYWTLDGSNLYPDSTGYSVGIGTTAPAERLHVNGDIHFGYNAIIAGEADQNSNVDHFWADDGDASYGSAPGNWHFSHDSSYKAAGNSGLVAGNVWMLHSGLINYFAGSVGIGITNPTDKLEVYGGDINVRADTPRVRVTDTGESNKYIEMFYEGGWGRLYTDGSNIYTNRMFRADGGLRVSDDEGFYRIGEDIIGTIGDDDDLRVDNLLIDTNGAINDSAITINDSSRYIWTPASGWGEYWNTSDNSIEWYGSGGTERMNFDLDNGNMQMDGALTVSGGQINLPYGNNAIESKDEWLRINDGGEHANGVYFGSSLVRTDNQMRSPVYYDQDDTSYYMDLNQTSNMKYIPNLGPDSNNPEKGRWNPLWTAIGCGKPVYTDEEFSEGNNGVAVYNNSGGDGVVHTRQADAGAPNASGYVIKISNNGNATSPGMGGFYQTITSRRNTTFVQRFRAKLPAGKYLNIAENSQGSNSTSYWLTSTAGTGKWEEYIRVSHCGNDGTFSSGGHVYVTGGSTVFDWYLASCNAYEVESPLVGEYLRGSGTTNYLPKYTGASSLGNSQIFDNGTGIGIGTTNPRSGYKLDMTGSIDMSNNAIHYASELHFNDNVRFYDAGNDNYLYYRYGDTGAGGIIIRDGDNQNQGYVYANGSQQFGLLDGDGSWMLRHLKDSYTSFHINDSEKMRINSSGNVGIGTTNPSKRLEISGSTPSLYVWASDSGTSDFFVGENSSGGYGMNLAWDSSYTYTMNSRYAGTNTAVYHVDTRNADLVMDQPINMGNQAITNINWGASDDGSGSGLDADLLDGLHASYFVPDIVSFDNITNRMDSGFYQSSSATIAEGWPEDASWYHLLANTHSNTGNYYSMQFAGDFYNSNDIFYRATNGSGTTAWNRLWHSGNDGSGSGLDADKLDGYQYNNLPYFGTTGGTMDGGTNTTLTILSDDAGQSKLLLHGDGQGTGYVYVGQSLSHGGGIVYNGDDNPDLPFSADRITIFRRTSSVDYPVLDWAHNSNTANFRGDINLNNHNLTNVNWAGSDDGSGSGLDADLLDGQQGSYYMPASTDNWVNVTGDTMSGALAFTDKGAGSTQLIKMGGNQLGGLYQISDRGGVMLTAADDTLVLADGDVGRNYGSNINPDGEATYILSDGPVVIKTDLQEGWGTEHSFVFNNAGNVGIGTMSPANTGMHMYGNRYTLYGPNSSWSAYLQVGGNSRQYVDNASYASVVTSNGNLHLDASSGHNLYLNYYDGGLVYFGNGANGTVGSVDTSGNMSLNGSVTANGGLIQDGNTILNGSDTWLRTAGQTGWYSATYGGGIYMADSTYVRTYNSKPMAANAYYDQDNTAYYLNPGGDSNIVNLVANGTIRSVKPGTSDQTYHAEFYESYGDAVRPIRLRFHQGSRWWTRIEANNSQFYFKTGDTSSENFVGINAGTITANGNIDATNHEVDNVNYLDFRNGTGYGVRFWSSNAYAINMGNAAEYKYGPVTDYSIKTNMSNTAGRGWTWGVDGSVPVAAIEATTGNMQIAGALTVGSLNVSGNLTMSGSGDIYHTIQSSSTSANVGTIYKDGDPKSWAVGLTGGSGDTFRISEGVSGVTAALGTNDRFTIEAGGNIGIGTTNPGYKLHVTGDIYANGGCLRVSGTNPMYFESYGGGWFMQDTSWIRTYNNKSVWTNSGVLGTNGGLTSGYGGASPPSGGAIISGSVGIGTSSPRSGYALDLAGSLDMSNTNVNYVHQLHFNDNVRFLDEGNDSYLRYRYGDTGAGGIKVMDGDDQIQGYLYASGGQAFGLLDGDGNWSYLAAKDSYTSFSINNSEKMRITSGGNVGIGKTNPGYDLDVVGNINFSGNMYQNGTLFEAGGGGGGNSPILLQAEYDTAVIDISACTNHSGTLTTSNTRDSETPYWTNYYQWEASSATAQEVEIIVSVGIPEGFSSWATSNAVQVDFKTENATASNCAVSVYAYKQGEATLRGSDTSNVSTSWATMTIDDSALNATSWATGNYIVLRIRMLSKSGYFARVGNIKLNFSE